MARALGLLLVTLALSACDGGGMDADGGMDGSTGGDCAGQPDGAACGSGLVCSGGACVASECGDGILDERTEECDDGNTTAFDGCEAECTFTCNEAAECDDGNLCNGEESCPSDTHACTPGTEASDGTACSTMAVMGGVCAAGLCVEPGCGNGVPEMGEDCDDGNDDPTDGCTATCEFTCVDDMGCDDGDVCNGAETCDLSTHTCVAGTDLVCDDGSDCTMDLCDAVLGCSTELIDGDGDGHAPDSIGACGDDCDDMRDDVYTGAEELCDGRDNNCDGSIDEVAPTWYIDCDADGFAADTTSSRTSCTMPSAAASGCSPGGWTTVRPVDAATTDCDDTDLNLNPAVTEVVGDEIDQNCDGRERCYLDTDDDGYRRPSGATITSTDTDCRDTREARASEPATDCCDQDARAHPGQTSYFTSPRTSCGGFDYNCNSSEERHYTIRGDCSSSCRLTRGWAGSVPACGVTASWWDGGGSICSSTGFSCIRTTGVNVQGCR